MDKKLKKIATVSRREMESFVRKHDRYNAEDLAEYCGISSFFLIMLGQKFGYRMTLVEGLAFTNEIEHFLEDGPGSYNPNHCWVEHKGMIIDLTATQFRKSLKKVHIVNANNKEYLAINRNNKAKSNFRRTWPHEQSPYSYISELRRRAKKVEEKLIA